jgi:hypothetical protein
MPTTTGERRGGTARPPERLAPGVPHRQGLITQGTSHPHFTAPPTSGRSGRRAMPALLAPVSSHKEQAGAFLR